VHRYTSSPSLIVTAQWELPEKIGLGLCLYISFGLIGRLWLLHRIDKFSKKLFWSIVLLFPLLGWIFYGAFYQPLASGDNPISRNPNIF